VPRANFGPAQKQEANAMASRAAINLMHNGSRKLVFSRADLPHFDILSRKPIFEQQVLPISLFGGERIPPICSLKA
jgi:hypothetical protein